MSNNPAPCSLLPTPYSQEDVATLLRFGISRHESITLKIMENIADLNLIKYIK